MPTSSYLLPGMLRSSTESRWTESFAKSVGMLSSRPGSILQLTRDLRKHDLIDKTTSALLDDLRVFGNTAAHKADAEFTEQDALRFGEYSERLIQQLRTSAYAAAIGPPGPTLQHP